ncbi:hypothetical protein [Lacrimispora sp.]|jgi:hypothetical protein|uniref:hypothetical protein n=1 Tax=Lacrimispora sp. TaxID=2719234 RepID=UPI0028A2D8F8|nr:hypothetical protein [Lacrimispora sp.]
MDLTGFVILICACIVLYLDVFRWDLISKFRNKKLVYEWINFKWGEKGVRITTGLIAIAVILSGMIALIQ